MQSELEVCDAIVQFKDGLPAGTLGFIFFGWSFLNSRRTKENILSVREILKNSVLKCFSNSQNLPRQYFDFGLLRLLSISAKMEQQATLQESCQD